MATIRIWRVGTHGFLKTQGAPGVGLAGAETLHAKLVTARLLGDGDVDGRIGRAQWRASMSLALERLAFANPLGEQAGPFGPNVSEAQALTHDSGSSSKYRKQTHAN